MSSTKIECVKTACGSGAKHVQIKLTETLVRSGGWLCENRPSCDYMIPFKTSSPFEWPVRALNRKLRGGMWIGLDNEKRAASGCSQPLSFLFCKYSYSVLSLRSQPTRLTPILPNKIAPGVGVKTMLSSSYLWKVFPVWFHSVRTTLVK